MKPRDKKIIVAAIFCLCVMLGAQVAQTQAFIFLIPLVFGLAVIAGYAFAWLCANGWGGAPAGVTADSALSLFYNAKNNEFNSLTVGLKDESSSINATGYYLGRKAEYATMNFLNNTEYPTFPYYQIMNYSAQNINQSVFSELYNTGAAWLYDYTSAIQDSVRYAKQSFIGPLAGLDLKLGSSSVKTMTNDFELMAGQDVAIPSVLSGSPINYDAGALLSNGSNIAVLENQNQGANALNEKFILINEITNANITETLTNNVFKEISVPLGAWEIWIGGSSSINSGISDNAEVKILTDGVIINLVGDPTYTTTPLTAIYSNTTKAIYTTLNFIDTHATTYTIDLTNTTQCDPNAIMVSLDSAQNFAMSLAGAYWSTLEYLGIHQASDIPSNMVIPPPDIAFLTNQDLSQLSVEEIQAMYLAYLKALGNFYNSTTYTTLTQFSTANVTFANEAVIVNATAARNGTIYTQGDLYLQVYQDMTLIQGVNTLNSSGLIYNLNDTTCWSYAAGDVLNITNIWVKVNGTYQKVNETTITALTIDAYIYNSSSGTPLQPTPSATGGGGSSGLLIIAIIVILVLMLRGRAGSSTTNNYKITRSLPIQRAKTLISPFFRLGEK